MILSKFWENMKKWEKKIEKMKFVVSCKQISEYIFENGALYQIDPAFRKSIPWKSKRWIWNRKTSIRNSARTLHLFYFYNLRMKTINTSQSTAGCRGGPQNCLRANKLSIKFQKSVFRCPGSSYLWTQLRATSELSI